VSRVGGLAVALALAAALTTGWNTGLAWADESGGADKSTASSAEAKTTESEATTGSDGDAPPPSQAAEPPETNTAETPAIRPAKKKRDSEPAPTKPTRAQPTRTKTPTPASAVEHSAPAPTAATRKDATDTGSRVSAPATPATVASLRVTSTETTPVLTTAVVPPKPVPPNPIRAVTALVPTVVNAILSPFAAGNIPRTPAEAPSIWSLLAFARREFERAFSSPSLNETPVRPPTTSQTTEERTLILSAFPAETNAILARTTLDPNPSVVVDGHHFYLGTLGGKKVIVAMTGIGMVNATHTTEIALDHFTPESGISVGAVVFSGVAGGSGRTEIGDVAVPSRWTSDDGETWHAVDPGMLAVAETLDVDLLSRDSIGDPTCFCGLFGGPQIDLKREPDLHVGGDGSSDDNNNGTAFPALPSIPFVGDIFGPQPCAAPDFSLLFTGNLFQAVLPFLAFGLVSNLTGLLSPAAPPVDAVDQETAAAQQVAEAHGVPFLGIRGMSDGPGDPLHLPGYPFTFVVYKQIAADNAAIVTEAFLQNWDGA
jgi:nucleoside phosphorylase